MHLQSTGQCARQVIVRLGGSIVVYYSTNLRVRTRPTLNRIHRALLAADPGSISVTHEALEWGFWHFGEVSRIYKKCFGELPSDTLRRSR